MIPTKQQILRARAEALARPVSDPHVRERGVRVVEFMLGLERYAIEEKFVREVLALKDLTPLPCTPPFVVGIVSVRGQIVAVLDINRFFGLPVRGLTDWNKIIVLRSDQMRLGILADAIVGMRTIAPEDFQTLAEPPAGIRAEYVRSMTRDRIVVLNADRILNEDRIVIHDEVDTFRKGTEPERVSDA